MMSAELVCRDTKICIVCDCPIVIDGLYRRRQGCPWIRAGFGRTAVLRESTIEAVFLIVVRHGVRVPSRYDVSQSHAQNALLVVTASTTRARRDTSRE